MPTRILFLTLDTFSKTGGIQQYNRVVARGLERYACEHGAAVDVWSAYDTAADAAYLSAERFRGFGGRRGQFFLQACRHMQQYDLVLLAHINLWPLVWLCRLMRWSCKPVLLTHGVEVWGPLPMTKRRALQWAHRVTTVSRYTADKLLAAGVLQARLHLLPNVWDASRFAHTDAVGLARRIRLPHQRPTLLSVGRLAATEGGKGYDTILQLLPVLAADFPNIRYVVAGPAEPSVYHRLLHLATTLGVQHRLVLPGFLPDAQLAALFLQADVFVLPSTKEGFGIVFLEAVAAGMEVVGLRAGGVPEALQDGAWGRLATPNDPQDLEKKLREAISNALQTLPEQRKALADSKSESVEAIFGENSFQKTLEALLSTEL